MPTHALISRLLDAPDLAATVPQLPAAVVHRVIQTCGLEDAGEFVALLTPAQLAATFDIDLWRAAAPGLDETFDADRFAVWIAVLMQADPAAAAATIAALDPVFVSAALSQLAAVFDGAAVMPWTTLDGEQAPARGWDGPSCELGGYVIQPRRSTEWDAIVELLATLESERNDWFHRVMRGCVRLSHGRHEANGMHDLLADRDQAMFDMASGRTERRDTQGYASPGDARAFLDAARRCQIDAIPPETDPIARAYFMAIADPAPAVEPAAPHATVAAPSLDDGRGTVEVLRDAGLLATPAALLSGATADVVPLRFLEAHALSHGDSVAELAYLANVLVAGASLQGRPFTPREAGECVMATCNLGLENWPLHWKERSLVLAFQIGWTLLHRDICEYATRRVADALEGSACPDRDLWLALQELRHTLMTHLRAGNPWRSRDALDALLPIDAEAWAALHAIVDECPTIHRVISSPGSTRIVDPGDVRFICSNDDRIAIRRFLDGLPARLNG